MVVDEIMDTNRFEIVEDQNLLSSRFVESEEPTSWRQGKPLTLFDKVLDYFGIKKPAPPKTAPWISETGKVEVDEPVNPREQEVMRAMFRAVNAASFGAADMVSELVQGKVDKPETVWGTVLGAGAELAGFLSSPLGVGKLFASSNLFKSVLAVGSRVLPNRVGLRVMANLMGEGGASLGVASMFSSLLPSLMESENLTDAVLNIVESTGMSTLIGMIFPLTSIVPTKSLRMAVGLAVIDKIRAGIGQWFTIDDVVLGVINGTIDKKELAESAFGYMMDLYFLNKVTSMKKMLEPFRVNKAVDESAKISPEEIEDTLMAFRDNGLIPGSKERFERGVDFIRKQEWEEFKEANKLRVAVRDKDGVVYEGKEGQIHAQIEVDFDKIGTDGYVTKSGDYYTRKEMLEIFRGFADPQAKSPDMALVHWRETETRVDEILRPSEHMGLIHGAEQKTVAEYGLESKGGLVVDRVYFYKHGQEKEGIIPTGGLYLARIPSDKILDQTQAAEYRKIAREVVEREGEYAPGDTRAIEEVMYKIARDEGFWGMDAGEGVIKVWVDVPVRSIKQEFLGKIVKSHTDTDGSTFNVMTGENLVGKPLYSVSIYPEEGIQFKGKEVSESQLKEYIAQKARLLSDPNNNLGTYYEKETDTTYLDVSITIKDKGEALRLARINNQNSIYDLKNKEVITANVIESVGGTSQEASAGGYKTTLPSVIELPELVNLAKELVNGNYPVIKQKLRAMRGAALGLFRHRGRIGQVELKADIFKDEKAVAWILGHEVGHVVNWVPKHSLKSGNILGRIANLSNFMGERIKNIIGTNKEITAELKALTQLINPFDVEANPKYTKYRHKSSELYAEAITALVNAPHILKQVAPKFYDAFFNHLYMKPEVERLYNEIQDSIRSGNVQKERSERLRRALRDGDLREQEAFRNRKDLSENWKTALIDKHNWIISRIKKIGEKNLAPGENPRYALERMDYRVSEHEGYMIDIHSRVLKAVELSGASYEDFREWLVHKRITTERTEIANPQGWTKKTSGERLAEMQQQMPDAVRIFEEAHNRFWELRNEFVIDKLKALNYYSKELMEKITDNEFYVTFDVQKYFEQKYGTTVASKIYTNYGAKIFKQHGTLQDIFDPFARTIMKDISLMSAANKIRAVKSVIGFLNDHYKGEIEKVKPTWSGGRRIFTNPTNPEQGLIVDMHNGKAQGYNVPKELMKSFESNPLEAIFVTKLLRNTVQPFRTIFTEINYGFWFFNIFRDYFRAARNLPKGSIINFAKYWAKGIKPAFKSVYGIPDPIVKEMLQGNMLISVADSHGIRAEDRQIEKLLTKYHIKEPEWNNKVIRKFGQLFNFMTNIGRGFERTTKVASYEYLKEKFPQMPKEQVEHIVRSWAGSPDFLRKGTFFPIYNNFLVFSNAMKEGYRGDLEVMSNSPATFMYKSAKYYFLPKMLMFTAKMGLLGLGIQAIMDGATEYDMTNYYVIPLGKTDQGKSVYFRIPVDETGRFMGGVFWKMLNKNVNLVEGGMLDYMAGQAPTAHPLVDIAADVLEYFSGGNPYDEFRSRYAIPDQVWRAQDWRTTWAFAKYIANKAGIGLVYRFKTEDDVEIRGTLEQIIGLPILNNILGRFIKVTDYGHKEHIRRDILAPIRQDRAAQILDAHEAVSKFITGQKLTDKQWGAILREEMRGSQVINRSMMTYIGRRYGTAYVEALLSANNIEERLAILREMIKKEGAVR